MIPRIILLIFIGAVLGSAKAAGAVPSQTDFDSTYFATNALPISLVGNLTNYSKLGTNTFVNKAGDTMTGTLTVTGLTNSALTASRAVVSAADKSLASSATTATELGYVSGVTSAIQTQLDGKQASLGYTPVNKAGDTMTGTLLVTGLTNSARTASRFVVAAADKSDTTTATSQVLIDTLSDEIGTGAAVFNTSPTFNTSITLTNSATGTVPLVINHAASATADVQQWNVAGTTLTKITKDGQIALPAGVAGTPSVKMGSNIGIYEDSSGVGRLVSNGNGMVQWDTSAGLSVFGTGAGQWRLNLGSDLNLSRENTAVLQFGLDAATATAQTLKAHDGSGTDKAGASLTIEGGQSTGTGTGGAVILRTSQTSTTGSSANAYTERFHAPAKFVDLTESTATTLFTIPVAAANFVGLTATVTVFASDGTDHQALTSTINVNGVAKTTTITPTVTQVDGTTAASSGTLTCTYTVTDNGSNVMAVKANAVSSLTQTMLRCKIVVTAINSSGTAALTEQ